MISPDKPVAEPVVERHKFYPPPEQELEVEVSYENEEESDSDDDGNVGRGRSEIQLSPESVEPVPRVHLNAGQVTLNIDPNLMARAKGINKSDVTPDGE